MPSSGCSWLCSRANGRTITDGAFVLGLSALLTSHLVHDRTSRHFGSHSRKSRTDEDGGIPSPADPPMSSMAAEEGNDVGNAAPGQGVRERVYNV